MGDDRDDSRNPPGSPPGTVGGTVIMQAVIRPVTSPPADASDAPISSTVSIPAVPDQVARPVEPTQQSALAMTECPTCHVATPVARYCSDCGAPLVQRRFCSECGLPMTPGAKFCEGCGTKFA